MLYLDSPPRKTPSLYYTSCPTAKQANITRIALAFPLLSTTTTNVRTVFRQVLPSPPPSPSDQIMGSFARNRNGHRQVYVLPGEVWCGSHGERGDEVEDEDEGILL